jgi:L-aspartate oxidase
MTAVSLDVGRAPVIIGGGLAGLMTASRLAPMPAVVLAKAPLGAEASSGWAQGGIAAAIGPDDDPELHLADTLAAGDGLCDVAGRAADYAGGAGRHRNAAPVRCAFRLQRDGCVLPGSGSRPCAAPA